MGSWQFWLDLSKRLDVADVVAENDERESYE
jgi:hypothetical protein